LLTEITIRTAKRRKDSLFCCCSSGRSRDLSSPAITDDMTSQMLGVKAFLRNPLLSTHRGKEPNKFQFDIVIERVHGGSPADYTIKWCRGVKTATTKPFTAEPKRKEGVQVGQKLSLLCTLYRSKATAEGLGAFEAKDTKLSLISQKDGKKSDKTVGKVHFDLSQFAGIPSATTQHTFELNAKTKVDTSITCTFVRVSRGVASSTGSGMSGMTISSGEYDAGAVDELANADTESCADLNDEICDPTSPMSAPSAEDGELEGGGNRQAEVESTQAWNVSLGDIAGDDSSAPTGSVSKSKASAKTRASPSSVSSFKSKAKIAALETEVEQLRHKYEDAQKETEKAQVVNQMSEDIIRELREKIEYSHSASTNKSGGREKELQALVDSLQRHEAMSRIEMEQAFESYESRIATLKAQVDTMERTKERVECERETMRKQVSSLENMILAESNGKDEAALASKARDKLMAEVSELRDSSQASSLLLKKERQRSNELEVKCRDADTEIRRLHSKLDAHEEHSEQIKSTYEELSKMYTALRDEHVRVQEELKVCLAIASQSSATEHKARFLRKSKPTKQGTEAESSGVVALEEEVRKLKAELEGQRRLVVESERDKIDAQKQTASLEGDVNAAKAKAVDARREINRMDERLEASKAKYLALSEQVEAALQTNQEHEVAVEKLKRKHRDEMSKLQLETKEEIKNLRLVAIPESHSASIGDTESHVKHLEDAIAESAKREDRYEQEILSMTAVVDNLSGKLNRAAAAADREQSQRTISESVAIDSATVRTKRAAAGTAPTPFCSNCREAISPSSVDTASCVSIGKNDLSTNKTVAASEDNFISSSSIRKINLLEKITDNRLLNMLVETKMKLAVAEEEKLALDHLIRRIRTGDKHIQAKLAQHASKLEVKLNQANIMLASKNERNPIPSEATEKSSAQNSTPQSFTSPEPQLMLPRQPKTEKAGTSKPEVWHEEQDSDGGSCDIHSSDSGNGVGNDESRSAGADANEEGEIESGDANNGVSGDDATGSDIDDGTSS
jgi:N-terminal C2 in EEIG1 and EHBP1 proteins